MAVKQILGKVTVTPKGEYSSGETYKRLDIVTSNGQSYIAKVDNTGVSVTDTNTWLQLVEKPEKGIDYFTEEDIAQLVSMVTDDSESEFNEYYNGKVSDFNSNASSKTTEFNSNYDEKVESFNTIFDTSTDNFDGNYETKLSAFNENASTQTSTFNSVVEQATSDFNSNASTLTETFNTNASEKTSAFNTNASEKTQEFNDNVDEKTEQITSQLDNYVQFDNYATQDKAGVVKSHINGFQVSNDGNPNAAILSKEQYDTIENQYFIGKGTLENIKDDYVGSSTPVKNLNNSLKDITPKQDAEGTDNTITDALDKQLFALGGDGKSEQETTSGSNLCGLKSNTIAGVTATILDDGTAKITGTATNDSNLDIMNGDIILEPGDYVFSVKTIDGTIPTSIWFWNTTDSNSTLTFNSSINQKNTNLDHETVFNSLIVTLTQGISYDMTIQVQVNKGMELLPYEPYTGGQPSPSPDYPQEINSIEGSLEFACSDKNLLPYPFEETTKTENGITFTDNRDGTITVNGTATAGTFFKVFATQTNQKKIPGNYISGSVTGCNIVIAHKEDNKYSSLGSSTNGNSSLINKELYDIGYVELSISQGVTLNNVIIKPMLSIEQNVDWEPYIEPNEVTFNLGQEKLRSVGDVKDELVVDLDTGDYYKVENVGEVVFDGSDDENWNNVPDGTGKERYTSSIIQNLVYTGTKLCQSNYFKNDTSEEYYEDGTIKIAPSGGVTIYDDLFTSLDNFKQWLSTHNTIVDYILQTPTTKKLGTLSAEDLAKLKTFKGYNNVTVNTNLGLMNIRFTYGLDIKKYVDNKIAELSAQLIKGE